MFWKYVQVKGIADWNAFWPEFCMRSSVSFQLIFFQMEVSSLEFLKSVKGSSRGRHLAGLTGPAIFSPAIFRSEPGFFLGWSTKATKSNDWKLRTNVFWSIFGKLYLSWIDPEISTRVFAKNLSILINYKTKMLNSNPELRRRRFNLCSNQK